MCEPCGGSFLNLPTVHAPVLRHYCITSLERSGISPKTAQTLARHSNIHLTLGVYPDIGLHEQTAAIGALPGPPYQPQRLKRVGGHRPSEWAASGALQRCVKNLSSDDYSVF